MQSAMTDVTESWKASCPETGGSSRHITHPTTDTDESAWDLLPASCDPLATSDMSHARTADTGAPQKTTKAPVQKASNAMRGRVPRLAVESATDTSAAMVARCEPETATRWAEPHLAKRSSTPRSSRAALLPQTQPARTARSSLAPGSIAAMTCERIASRDPRSPLGPSRAVTLTTLTLPQSPWHQLEMP